jgi:hypothetical protein
MSIQRSLTHPATTAAHRIRAKSCDTPLFVSKLGSIHEEEDVESSSSESESEDGGIAHIKPKTGYSVVFGTVQTVTEYEDRPVRVSLQRRLSLSQRVTDSKHRHTLIHYSRDPLDQASIITYVVPNSEMCDYTRTALLRAHNSATQCEPTRLCGCQTNCSHQIDRASKMVAIYMLDSAVSPSRKDA